MRVLIINTAERIGGAAIAANRLMEALKNNGIKAKMLVRNKQTDQVTVVSLKKSWRRIWQFTWERIVIWAANGFKRHNLFAVDIANTGTDITSLPEFRQADVIHLHWINQGMLSLKDIQRILASGKPVVWTMHDMWPFTGICHYSGECEKYTAQCHDCPLLLKPHHHDLSEKTFHKSKSSTLRLPSRLSPAANGWKLWHAEAVCCKDTPLQTFPMRLIPTCSSRVPRNSHARSCTCPPTRSFFCSVP